MSKIEDKLITKECYAMRDIILENFTREAKWLYYQMDIIKYLEDKGINLACDYKQKIKDLQSQLDQANERLKKETEERQHLQCDYKTLLSHYNNLKESAILPKFKIGQEVYYYHIARNKIYLGLIEDIQYFATRCSIFYRIPNLQRDYFWIREDELFATEQEAQAKLQELRGGE